VSGHGGRGRRPGQDAGTWSRNPKHLGQPAVRADHGHVEAGDGRRVVARAELPAEPALVMMPVHRAGEAEREAGKLLLNGRYGRIDCRVPQTLASGSM